MTLHYKVVCSVVAVVLLGVIGGISYAHAQAVANSTAKETQGSAIGNAAHTSGEMVPVFIAFTGPVEEADIALVRAFGGKVRYNYNLVDAVAARVPKATLRGLENHPLVTRVELDTQVETLDVELENTWSVSQIEAHTVHDTAITPTSTGEGVKIGIIDSGVNYNHPELRNNFDQADLGYDFYNYSHDPIDVYGHGTHVAGSACAEKNNNGEILDGDKFGVVGVAPDCQLYSLRVHSDDGVAYWSDIIAAVDYATGVEIYLPGYWDSDVGAPEDPIQGPKLDIINLSLGKSAHPGEIVKASFDAAYYEHDLLIVAAAGNSGNRGGNNDSIIYPAKFDSVLAVGATDRDNTRATWSSTGPALEIVAPGAAVYSTWNNETAYANPQPVCRNEDVLECYKYGSGTSMASPHVAGVAALMIAADKATNGGERTLGAAALRTLLTDTAAPLGDSNEYGHGLVNALAAVQAVLDTDGQGSEPPDNTALTADFTTDIDDLTVQFTDTSTSDAAVTDWSWDFGDGASSTVQNPSHTYAEPGTYTVSLTVSDGELTDTATVSITVTEDTSEPGVPLTADFTTQINDLTVHFTDTSTPDDTVTTWSWDFGDGASSTEQNPSHTYAGSGTYQVTLTVTDADDETASTAKDVTVTEPAPESVTLSLTGYKQRGFNVVELNWSGVTTESVDIYRNGSHLVKTPNNSGQYIDNTNDRGGATYTYRVCEAQTTVCSAAVDITF